MTDENDPKSAVLAEGETCQRCGEIGEDRRTLRMSCFYAMEELGLPLLTEMLLDAEAATLTRASSGSGIDLPDGKRIALVPPTFLCSGELRPLMLYTLRVCKGCRASWLRAIAAWFRETPFVRPSPGTGIFIRRQGENVEITREEFDQYERLRQEDHR